MFSCPGCGGEMRFEPSTQKLRCDHCDKLLTVSEYTMAHPSSNPMAKGPNQTDFDTYVFVCPQCGGELMTDENTVGTFCSYCGSSVQLEPRITKAKAPDFVIPFSKTKEDCVKAYKGLLARSLFAPSEFRQDDNIERFRGIYMPYWIYAFSKKGKVKTTGEISYRRGDYIYTDHYDVYFDVDSNCAGVSYDASSYFADELSAGIAPFNMEGAQYFNTGYLSGYYADASDVSKDLYVADGKKLIARETASRAARMLHTKSALNMDSMQSKLEPDVTRTNLGFFPVWFLANKNKKGDRVSYAVVNGQTGRVAADIPVSPWKFALGTIAIAAVFFLLLNLFFTLTPLKAAVVTGILSIVSWVIINKQQDKIFTRRHYLDDKGVQEVNPGVGLTPKQKKAAKRTRVRTKSSKPSTVYSIIVQDGAFFFIGIWLLVFIGNFLDTTDPGGTSFSHIVAAYVIFGGAGFIALTIFRCVNRNRVKKTSTREWYAAPLGEKWKYCWKNFVALVVCGIAVLAHPVEDIVYYSFVVASIVLVGWSFFDVIHQHNELTSRPLPQFNKRGGEEHENR